MDPAPEDRPIPMKVVVSYVPAGSGHQRASEALAAAIQQRHPEAEVELLDALRGVDGCYRWAYTKGYLQLIRQMPALWGLSYYATDHRWFAPVSQRLHRINNHWHGRGLERLLIQMKPDAIFGTHFFPMEVASYLKQTGQIQAKLITVITDYFPHELWAALAVDRYVVGSPKAREELIRRGIPPERIEVLGIPINPKFLQHLERRALAQKLGIDPERFTVLIGSGGGGVGPVAELVKCLGQLSVPLQILVVAGTNDRLFRRLEQQRAKIHHPMKVYGFINFMDELMDVSDLIVTKSGGLTCAEAAVKKLPMILLRPIPGQEMRNARYLEDLGTALLAGNPHRAARIVRELQQNPKKLKALKEHMGTVSFPEAAFKIAELAFR